jgi:hypothetical protein
MMKRMIPKKAKPAITTFTQTELSIDNMSPPSWEFGDIPITTHLKDCPVFQCNPFYFKNKFDVKRKNIIDHGARLEKLRYGVICEKVGHPLKRKMGRRGDREREDKRILECGVSPSVLHFPPFLIYYHY